MLRLVAAQNPAPVVHLPPLSDGPVVFATGDVSLGPPYSEQALAATMALGDKVVLAIEVRPTRDQVWLVYGSELLEIWTNGHGTPEQQQWSDLAKVQWTRGGGGLLRLEEFLARFQPDKLMVIVHSREVAAASSLLRILGLRSDPKITFIFSPHHRLNREFKKQRPLWFVGADLSQLTQWQVFAALGLEGLAGTDFEWRWSGQSGWHKDHLLDPRLNEELRRRRVGEIVLLGESTHIFSATPLYGVLTSRPTEVLRRMGRLINP